MENMNIQGTQTSRLYSFCQRCSKPLSDPVSMSRGYGKICYMKLMRNIPLGESDYEEDLPEYEFVELTTENMKNLINLEPITITGKQSSRQIFIGKEGTSNLFELSPNESFQIKMHSSNGFNWGYSGSGSAQLALAIVLLYVKDKEWIDRLYQNFKWEIIAGLPHGKDFQVTIDIGKWFYKYFKEEINNGINH